MVCVCVYISVRVVELSRVEPVFGVSLDDHLQHTDRLISTVIEQSITALCSPEYDALHEEVTINHVFTYIVVHSM